MNGKLKRFLEVQTSIDKYCPDAMASDREHDSGINHPWVDKSKDWLTRRQEEVALYRTLHPEATEAQTYAALDYEEYRRIIMEQFAVLKIREGTIQDLRLVVSSLREQVDRMQAEIDRLQNI